MIHVFGILTVASDVRDHGCLRKGGTVRAESKKMSLARQPGAPQRDVFPRSPRSDLGPICLCGAGPGESAGIPYAGEIYAALLKPVL